MLNRSELEDIWENRPYGYFQTLMKKSKGKKKYTLTCSIYRQSLIARESTVVYAKNATDAMGMTYDLRRDIEKKHNILPYDPEIVLKWGASAV